MIVITGANGTLGRDIVQRLLARVPADQVGVSVRDPEQASVLAEQGVLVRRGDFANPAGLPAAFEGADQVLVVSAGALGDIAVQWNQAAIHAAARAGARRVLYTSHMAASGDSLFAPMPTHAASEQALAETGIAFTALRNGFYASTVLRLLGDAARTGEIVLPEDGPVSWTAHADLADAAVHSLTADLDGQGPGGGALDGVTPALTATEAVDMAAVAAIASELLGRPVRRSTVSDEHYREGLVARGTPEPAADLMVGMFRASRRGEFAAVDPTLTALLGRPTVPVRDVLKAALTPEPLQP